VTMSTGRVPEVMFRRVELTPTHQRTLQNSASGG
jgi:hypothetical protein